MKRMDMKPDAKSTWVICLLLILGVGWGLHFSLIKIAAESGLAMTGIMVLTTLGIFLGMSAITVFRRRWPTVRRSALRFYLICALLGYVVAFFVELKVAEHIQAGELTLIVTTTPVWTFLIAHLLRARPVSKRQVLGLLLGLGAAVALIVPDLSLASGSTTVWLVMAFLVPLTYASYHNVVEAAWPEGMDSWQVAYGETLLALVLLSPLYFFVGDELWVYADLSSGSWTVPVMAVLAIGEIYLYFEVVRLSGAVVVSQANYVSIISGILWGAAIFGEAIGYTIILCAALTFGSLFLTSAKQ